MMATSIGVGEAPAASGIAEREFELLVGLHQRGIYRLLLGLTRDPDAAETLTQECFLKAFQNRNGFRGEASVKTWLTRIAINLAYDHRRSRRVQFWKRLFQRTPELASASRDGAPADSIEPLLEAMPDQHSSAEQQLLAREHLAAVWKAVGRLSNQQRNVFLLRFVEEMSLDEIAEAIGVSVPSVKTHLRRATLAVRQAVVAWGA
jgi:RNA polymerase sigma-70 factor, ECF subfamily